MKIKWLGHACFLITSSEGVRIITDPFETGSGLSYKPVNEKADIVTVSHDHMDHNNASAVTGQPQVLKGAGVREIRGIKFKGIAAYHDENKGKQRGTDTLFCFNPDGINVCHLGDLGHKLSPEEIGQVGAIDVLLIPVGGLYTIDANGANQACEQLKPKVIIPMHYKTAKCDFPLGSVEEFIKLRTSVRRIDSTEIELQAGKLPAGETIVLKHAL